MKRIIKLWYFRVKLFSKKVTIRSGCTIGIHSTFEGCNAIGKNTLFEGNLGFGSYITDNAVVSGNIGRYCSIASGVKVLSGTHPLKDFVSTSPAFYSLLKQSNLTFAKEQHFNEFLYADVANKYSIIVGNDVWIGANAIIIGGITIGNGAVVLAGATVTKDVPPYAIVGGVPAKIISKRFDDDTIKFLEAFKWWEKPTEWLGKNVLFFHNIKLFMQEFEKQKITG
jgi:acetyltransferase-like isoleucine patch superfamily enzyme